MNCKPGDLAVVVRARFTPAMLGHYVVVVRAAYEYEFVGEGIGPADIVWIIKSASDGKLPTTYLDGSQGEVVERPFLDAALRPIRDPGEDAQDETLQWLPVPSQHKEVA